jgi:hypothetical protein
MGKTPVRMKAVVYALSPFQQKVMPGLWKDITTKIHHKVSENWISATLLLAPIVGTYEYASPILFPPLPPPLARMRFRRIWADLGLLGMVSFGGSGWIGLLVAVSVDSLGLRCGDEFLCICSHFVGIIVQISRELMRVNVASGCHLTRETRAPSIQLG